MPVDALRSAETPHDARRRSVYPAIKTQSKKKI